MKERNDTLWDSRYKSSLVQEDNYLLLCQRYIELNPVRAGMVDAPALYRWSSYRANALGQSDTLISPHSLYTAMATSDENRRALFRHQIDSGAIADIRLALSQSQPLGNTRFTDMIEKMTGQRREAKPRGRPKAQKPS